jgi:amino acid adenylation domain-containing protein
VAVTSEDGDLTFAELAERAAQAARQLKAAADAREESIVGICLGRGAALVVAVLAAVKAGSGYLPLDPEYPAERLDFMVRQAGAVIVMSDSALAESATWAKASGRTLIEMGTTLPEALPAGNELSPENGSHRISAENALYVAYTSGSTGKPKGVVVPNRALLNLFDWYAADTGISADDIQLASHSFSFDPATLEMLFPLLHGARVALAPQSARLDPHELLDFIASVGATIVNVSPSLLRRLLDEPRAAARMSSLRIVVCGGERFGVGLRDRFLEMLPDVRLVNHYGPTEATIFATSWDCRPGDEGEVPIGRPAGGALCYVLDESLEPSSEGAEGELFLGGTAVARGYASFPAMTAEAFLPDAFSGMAGTRMYRTGDRVRMRADGVLEFIGRIDNQVKLRGYRIELGEVEGAVTGYEGVLGAAAVVRAGKTGESVLAAFAEHDGSVVIDRLRSWLRTRLPEYMVPGHLELVEALPRTVTGKIDKARLPAEATDHSTGPRDSAERLMADIWKNVLNLSDVSIDDDFFALGGDSLLATRVIRRVRREFGVELPLITLFESRSIPALVQRVAEAAQTV